MSADDVNDDDAWVAPAFAHLGSGAEMPEPVDGDARGTRRLRTPEERAHLHRRVLEVVAEIPTGRVMTYGDIGALVGLGPREVGQVMAHTGAELPWWRVCNAAGRLPDHLHEDARHHHEQEGTALRGLGVDLRRARWRP